MWLHHTYHGYTARPKLPKILFNLLGALLYQPFLGHYLETTG